ncbi:MAG: hypothetical protein ACE5HE_07655, partial [Phycisphaerae bacterium]
QVTRTVEVSAVGGHLTMHEGFEGLTLFAAIVVLSDPAALPVGAPLDEGEVVASTVFDAGRPSSDVRVPLAATLDPGAYALIFGSGLFGATGVGGMPLNNADLPGASYFFWNGNAWIDDPFTDARFVVEGSICVIDSDGDGVDDDVDVCCNTPGFTTVDAQGRPVGDLDNDCDVDLADFVMFEIDLSAGYVQLNGFAGLQNNFTGELPADGPCR